MLPGTALEGTSQLLPLAFLGDTGRVAEVRGLESQVGTKAQSCLRKGEQRPGKRDWAGRQGKGSPGFSKTRELELGRRHKPVPSAEMQGKQKTVGWDSVTPIPMSPSETSDGCQRDFGPP